MCHLKCVIKKWQQLVMQKNDQNYNIVITHFIAWWAILYWLWIITFRATCFQRKLKSLLIIHYFYIIQAILVAYITLPQTYWYWNIGWYYLFTHVFFVLARLDDTILRYRWELREGLHSSKARDNTCENIKCASNL